MKTLISGFLSLFILFSCTPTNTESETSTSDPAPAIQGQSAVEDDVSDPTVVQVAVKSADHTTLVTAIQTAGLVDVLTNTGPFTVFAPTNAAFEKLPEGTVESLLKPEQKTTLSDILEYHVYVGVIKTDMMKDGQVLNQVNGKNIRIGNTNDQIVINGSAKIIASVPASNGIIHVLDEVLLPQ